MSVFLHHAVRFAGTAFLLSAVFAATTLYPLPSAAEEVPFSPYVETHPDGRVDWDEGVVYGVGKGYIHLNQGSRARALRAAQALALQSILKVAAGVRLDERETLESLSASGRVEIQLSALVRYEEHETVWVDKGDEPHARVTYRAPLKGVEGLTRRLITHLRETPSDWERFPLETQRPTAPPAGDLPWLVVDARNLPQDELVRPALFPQIRSTTGDTIYDLGSVREAALVERGMASYVNLSRAHDDLLSCGPGFMSRLRSLFQTREAWAQERRTRAKRGQFVITDAARAQGLSKTNLVISEEDARKIREEDASSNILKDCRVIVIVSGTVGGIEGQLPVPEKAFTKAFGSRRL